MFAGRDRHRRGGGDLQPLDRHAGELVPGEREPGDPGRHRTRYFATDTRGTIFQDTAALANPIPARKTPVQ